MSADLNKLRAEVAALRRNAIPNCDVLETELSDIQARADGAFCATRRDGAGDFSRQAAAAMSDARVLCLKAPRMNLKLPANSLYNIARSRTMVRGASASARGSQSDAEAFSFKKRIRSKMITAGVRVMLEMADKDDIGFVVKQIFIAMDKAR